MCGASIRPGRFSPRLKVSATRPIRPCLASEPGWILWWRGISLSFPGTERRLYIARCVAWPKQWPNYGETCGKDAYLQAVRFTPYCPVKLPSLHKLVKLAALHAVGWVMALTQNVNSNNSISRHQVPCGLGRIKSISFRSHEAHSRIFSFPSRVHC